MIIIEPLGGLANRMRFIASAIWLKMQLNHTSLYVIWNDNYELGSPYHLLFEKSNKFEIIKKRWHRFITSSHKKENLRKIFTDLINKLLGIDYCITEPEFPELIWTGKLDILKACSLRKNIYIKSCHQFGDNIFAYNEFNPIPTLSRKIYDTAKIFDRYTIGVHIRRTDNELSISQSPLYLFIEKMNDEVVVNKDINFFVCSDDENTLNKLKKIFGSRIKTRQREISRQSIQGMQDAVIDMFCLAKTSKILGSYNSSFSEICAKINNIPLLTIRII